MNHNSRIMFIELVGGYLIFREDSENPLAPKEEAAINEIMHWNHDRAIEYFIEEYPHHADKFENRHTFGRLTDEDRLYIIHAEINKIINNMIIY